MLRRSFLKAVALLPFTLLIKRAEALLTQVRHEPIFNPTSKQHLHKIIETNFVDDVKIYGPPNRILTSRRQDNHWSMSWIWENRDYVSVLHTISVSKKTPHDWLILKEIGFNYPNMKLGELSPFKELFFVR